MKGLGTSIYSHILRFLEVIVKENCQIFTFYAKVLFCEMVFLHLYLANMSFLSKTNCVQQSNNKYFEESGDFSFYRPYLDLISQSSNFARITILRHGVFFTFISKYNALLVWKKLCLPINYWLMFWRVWALLNLLTVIELVLQSEFCQNYYFAKLRFSPLFSKYVLFIQGTSHFIDLIRTNFTK